MNLNPLGKVKYFEWIIKQLLNSAFLGCEEFCKFSGWGGGGFKLEVDLFITKVVYNQH